ncbi:hypothetical protein BZA05DRAFT_412260, partial [Tricharina praecox]|uniref:uncharacterized protein n=1 Tax=Tricharina praecox TaxID=43433 RepID=UPI00222036F7
MSMLDASLEHKSTPVERKTTPVERKTTPVELKTTPVVGTKAAVVAPSAIPVLRIETLAERRTASPVGSLNLERKITPADRSSAVTPPPPAPTPPPQAPTPPPMPPTPPPARGSMATISEDAPLPSPTKLTFGNGRRSGPPRGTFGYTFHTSGPPLGNSRPNSQGGSSPPHSPGEPNFGYFPASAPISRTASPAFGGASKSAPISRTASPAPVNEAQGGKSPDLTLGGMGRTTFGYSFD